LEKIRKEEEEDRQHEEEVEKEIERIKRDRQTEQ